MSSPAIEAIVMSAVTSETKTSGKVRKVTFLLPNDDPDHPFAGMVGERLHIVCVKVNDDETTEPVSKPPEPKERRSWADLPPSQQAAIRCGEPEFTRWLWSAHYQRDDADAAGTIRRLCGVESRADLNANHKARMVWFGIDTEYMQATGRLARSA